MAWKATDETEKFGVVNYTFVSNGKHELPVQIGQRVFIKESCDNWFRGYCLRNRNVIGIFPKTVITLLPCEKINKKDLCGEHTAQGFKVVEDILFTETNDLLIEWVNVICKNVLLEQDESTFEQCKAHTKEVLAARRALHSSLLTETERTEVKQNMSTAIEKGNRLLKFDVFSRDNLGLIDVEKTSLNDVYNTQYTSKAINAPSRKFAELSTSVSTRSRQAKGESKRSKTRRSRSGSIFTTRGKFQLFFELKHFVAFVGENTDIYFRVYDNLSDNFLCEPFHVKLSPQGMPLDLDLIGKMSTIFNDIPQTVSVDNKAGESMFMHLSLVCLIYRNGKLVAGDKSKDTPSCKRPFGCGVIRLSEVPTDGGEHETMLELFTCSEANFWEIYKNMLSDKGNYEPIGSMAKGVVVGLRIMLGPLSEALRLNPMLMQSGTPLSKIMSLPSIIDPGMDSDILYLFLHQATFKQGTKKTAKNMEVQVCIVHNQTGEVRKDCIRDGIGEKMPISEYYSVVYYHNNSPKYNEVIRIELSHDQWIHYHVRLAYRHVSSEDSSKGFKANSFSWMPLISKNTTLPIDDGQYELTVLKAEKKFKDPSSYMDHLFYNNADTSGGGYFSSPETPTKNKRISRVETKILNTKGESVVVSTVLCSTRLTHDEHLQSVLHWRLQNCSVKEIIESARLIPDVKKVQFFVPILSCLIEMLQDKTQVNYKMDAFDFMCSLLEKERVKVTLEDYIHNHFKSTTLWRDFLDCCTIAMERKTSTGNSVFFRALIAVVRMIRQSFICERNQTMKDFDMPTDTSQETEEFRTVMKDLFFKLALAINKNLDNSQLQMSNYENLDLVLTELTTIFPMKEAYATASAVIGNLSNDPSVAVFKLSFLSKIITGALIDVENKDADDQLFNAILKVVLSNIENPELKNNILDLLSLCIAKTVLIEKSQETLDLLLDLVNPLFGPLYNPPKVPMEHVLVLILLDLFRMFGSKCLAQLLARSETEDDKRERIKFLLQNFEKLNECDFGKAVSVKMAQKLVTSRMVMYLAEHGVKKYFIGYPEGQDTMHQCVEMLITMACDDDLQLNRFTPMKAYYILDYFGDLRVGVAKTLRSLWDELNIEDKSSFIEKFENFFRFAMICNREVRDDAIPILLDFRNCGEFKKDPRQFEITMIDLVRPLIDSGCGDKDITKHIQEKFIQDDDLELSFMKTVLQLIELHIDLRDLTGAGAVDYVDERNSTTVKLMELYRDLGRMDKYIEYVHYLTDFHSIDENYSEGAFSLLLHANLLDWVDDIVKESGSFPEQRQRTRKAILYDKIIDLFDKGKQWEMALKLSKELYQEYEKWYNYEKLSGIMLQMGKFYSSIISVQRYAPEFFRVGFYGGGFPTSLRNKLFVYRGLELERLTNFIDRMADQYPEAELIRSNKEVPKSVWESDGQHIQIVKVDPIPDPSKFDQFKGIDVNDEILKYYNANEVNKFCSTIGFRKQKTGNEFADTWMLKTYFYLESDLPSLLLRREVIKVEPIELTPIEVAYQTMLNKNNELDDLWQKVKGGNTALGGTFSMMLNGVLDAAVSGGPKCYREVFLDDPEYIKKHPDHEELVVKLQSTFIAQERILEPCIILHEKIVDEKMRGLHERQIELFVALTGRHPDPKKFE